VPAEGDAVSEASEVELREWEEEQEAEELGAGEGSPLFLPTPDFMVPAGEGWAVSGVSFPFFLSFVIFLVRTTSSWDRLGGGQRGACNVPPPRVQRTGNGLYIISP